jgi:CMP-N-acetylneuraminic acid synthetase
MNKNLYIVALIPARSGSKGIINKNIKLYNGIPLLAHSINIALESNYIKEVYVSTDSKEYQEIALKYNAKITTLRPKDISDDLSPDIDTFKHFLNMFDKNNLPDLIIHLRPTYPNRNLSILNNCIETFMKNYDNYDSLRTVIPIAKTPYKMYYINENKLIPFINNYKDIIEPFNQARQLFPQTYLHNGYIDIIKTNLLLNKSLLSGTKIYPYIMNSSYEDDIDYLDDFKNSENKI